MLNFNVGNNGHGLKTLRVNRPLDKRDIPLFEWNLVRVQLVSSTVLSISKPGLFVELRHFPMLHGFIRNECAQPIAP